MKNVFRFTLAAGILLTAAALPAETAGAADTATAPADQTGTETADPPEARESFDDDLDYAQVNRVVAVQESDGSWRFSVTVEHNDEGWDHYADSWQVVHPETGEVLAERVLAHPHVNDMPFTRSKSGVNLPDDVQSVRVRARSSVHGFGGREVTVDLLSDSGEFFEVQRP